MKNNEADCYILMEPEFTILDEINILIEANEKEVNLNNYEFKVFWDWNYRCRYDQIMGKPIQSSYERRNSASILSKQ